MVLPYKTDMKPNEVRKKEKKEIRSPECCSGQEVACYCFCLEIQVIFLVFLTDLQKFNLKDEGGVGWNDVAGSLSSISVVGSDGQDGLLFQ